MCGEALNNGAMKQDSISLLTICGLREIEAHRTRGVTHIMSILDPGHPEPETFLAHDARRRLTLRFHDEIEPKLGVDLPQLQHLEAILAFGHVLAEDSRAEQELHALVHCHAGASRSPSEVIPWLALTYDVTTDQALAWLRSKRFCVEPKSLEEIREYETKLRALGRR